MRSFAIGNPLALGGATFFWDGLGRVVIASDYDVVLGTFPIWADDELTATSSLGSVSFNEANPANTKVYGDDGLDITSILIPNASNQINLTITASGDFYGWSRLNLYQTNIINDGYHGFNGLNPDKVRNDIDNFFKDDYDAWKTAFSNTTRVRDAINYSIDQSHFGINPATDNSTNDTHNPNYYDPRHITNWGPLGFNYTLNGMIDYAIKHMYGQ